MIRDPYTNAHKAQIALTAHMLFGFVFKRKDGWKRSPTAWRLKMINRYVEFRHDTASGIVTGTVMKYGDVAHVGRTYHERFMPGSIEYDDVVLNLLHDRQQPVARLGAGA